MSELKKVLKKRPFGWKSQLHWEEMFTFSPGICQGSDFLVVFLADEVSVNFVDDVLTIVRCVTLDIREDLDQAKRGGYVVLTRKNEI